MTMTSTDAVEPKPQTSTAALSHETKRTIARLQAEHAAIDAALAALARTDTLKHAAYKRRKLAVKDELDSYKALTANNSVPHLHLVKKH